MSPSGHGAGWNISGEAPTRSKKNAGAALPDGKKKRFGLPEEPYPPYRPDRREKCLLWGAGAALGAAAGWLFFDAAAGLLLSLPAAWLLRRVGARRIAARRKREMTEGLRQYLLAVIRLLRSGYALENAMLLAERDVHTVCGADSLMAQEAARFRHGLELHIPPEKLWEEYAGRCRLRAAAELAHVFAAAKKQGGDCLPVLKGEAEAIEARLLLKEEIETQLTGQKLEFDAMCLIPAGILLYMRLAGDGMADPLFTTAAGRIISLTAVVLYAGAAVLGERILRKAYDTEE